MSNTIKTQADKISQSVIDGSILYKTTNSQTHFGSQHVGRNEVDRMERVLNNVSNDSTFESEETAEDFIQEALLYKAKDIATWCETETQENTKAFKVYFNENDGYDAVGTGFTYNIKNNTIKEHKTNALTLVLRKDPNSNLGFNILTAYPDMFDPNIKPTNKDLRPIIRQTKNYKQSDITGKTYLECRTNPDMNMLITYRPGYTPTDSVIMIKIPNEGSNTTHNIKFKENSYTLYTTDDSTHDKINTKYTQMRDQLNKKPDYKYTNKSVNLTNPVIRDEFIKDNPGIEQSLDNIFYTLQKLKHQYNPTIQPTQPTTNIDRIKKAEQLVANINENNNKIKQKGE